MKSRMDKIEEKKCSTSWVLYQKLMEERPAAFVGKIGEDCMLEIVTDLDAICDFEEKTGQTIGVAYKSAYSMMVVDLVKDTKGRMFGYERQMPAVARGAVVCLTRWQGKYILIRQYRHSLRAYQYAFVRGFGEAGLSAAENAEKELQEELAAADITTRYLGSMVADSGASGGMVDVFACEISDWKYTEGYEGIKDAVVLAEEEMKAWIREGKITDGYTLAALTMDRS